LRDGEILGFATVGPTWQNPTTGTRARDRELWSIYLRASEYGSGLADRLLETVLPQQAQLAWLRRVRAALAGADLCRTFDRGRVPI
jgi:GNAT superfamily N-acetyltransferase